MILNYIENFTSQWFIFPLDVYIYIYIYIFICFLRYIYMYHIYILFFSWKHCFMKHLNLLVYFSLIDRSIYIHFFTFGYFILFLFARFKKWNSIMYLKTFRKTFRLWITLSCSRENLLLGHIGKRHFNSIQSGIALINSLNLNHCAGLSTYILLLASRSSQSFRVLNRKSYVYQGSCSLADIELYLWYPSLVTLVKAPSPYQHLDCYLNTGKCLRRKNIS